ncbi:PAS domain-containing protein [Natrialba swarupiae]|uniref:PAS domain-containing protein n=1 Tax=Natrialba swarupiae TaxID=2448032 RepID=A0A5D5AP73_9EURY|nr:PAS domain-containing protein [Natrialba swarupiae]TYT62854.1 PAS domain-containing protein [Natrialba swarupiae]
MIEDGVDGFFEVTTDWRYGYVSEGGARLAGHPGEELRGECVWEIFPELEQAELADALRTAMDEREPSTLETYYPPHDTWYDVRVYPTENGLSIYVRDVSDLKHRAQQFEAIFDNTYTFVGLLDLQGTIVEVNDTALEFGDLDRENVIGKRLWNSYWVQENQDAQTAARNAVETARRGELFQDEIRIQGGDREATIDFTVRPITNGDGEVTHLLPEGRDITRREKLTRELRRERDFIEKALDTLTDIFYVVGTGGEIRRWNSRMAEILGYSSEEIADMEAMDFFPDDQTDRVSDAIEETMKTGGSVVEAELLTKAGDRIPYELTGARLTDPEGELIGLVGIGRDITEKNARERELQTQREHLEALNNLNTVVREITDAVIQQSTRDEIEGVTCDKLIESNSYVCAWIADADPHTEEVRLRTKRDDDSSGTHSERLVELLHPLEQSPIRATFETGTVRVCRDVDDSPNFEPWRDVAREGEFNSFMAVPLVYGNTQFGVLGLHSTRTNAFGRDEREIIEQLGEVVGYVFYAIERKEMLDSALELTFRSEKLADPFAHHGDEDIELTLETVVPLDTDENRFIEYWHVNDDFVDSFRDAVDQHDPKLDVRLLSTVDGLARCEVSAGAKSMSSVFASQGGKLRTASIDDNAVEIVGEFPDDVDPEQVTSGLRDAFPDIELVSQQRILTPQYLRQIVDENLTEKQKTALQLAYFSSYFEQPRSSTGEELADNIGVTKQTFHYHLRNAEETVFEILFEEPEDPLI